MAPEDAVDRVTIALIRALGDPDILGANNSKLTTEARHVIATTRKADLLEILTPDLLPRHQDGRSASDVQVPRSKVDDASAPDLQSELATTQRWLARYNAALDLSPAERRDLLLERLREVGEGAEIRPPFYCNCGFNIRLGVGVFLHVNCVILDVVEVTIGGGTQIGPGVQILTADRPRDPATRASCLAFGRSVRIGRNVWIGAGAIILPSVSIGDNAVIGAGSVATRDVPAGATAFGNPAQVRA